MILFPFILVYIHSCFTCQLMTLFLFQKKVIFSARKRGGGDFTGLVSYEGRADTIDVNVGGGMHSNGKFIAPESGTYGFTFSAVTGREESTTWINVYLDGNLYAHHWIYDGNEANEFNNINSSWMMKLTKGQVVHLDGGKLFATINTPVIFTGNLLMLDE